MKKLLVLACLLLLSACAGAPAEETPPVSEAEGTSEPLVVAMELAYPPFEMKDDAGEPDGISVALARAFGEHIGREVVIQNTAWDGLIPSLTTGSADMIISSMTITEARAETVDFSEPYANAMLAALVSNTSAVETVEELNQSGRTIAVKTGSTGHSYAMEHLTNAEILAFADESACVAEVSQGKADAFLYDQLTIYRNQQQNAETTKAIFIPFQDVDYWGVAVQKGNTELVTELNEFIASYRADGGFDALSETYLAEEKVAFQELGFQWFFDIT